MTRETTRVADLDRYFNLLNEAYAQGAWNIVTNGAEGYHDREFRAQSTNRELVGVIDQYRMGKRHENERGRA